LVESYSCSLMQSYACSDNSLTPPMQVRAEHSVLPLALNRVQSTVLFGFKRMHIVAALGVKGVRS
jgi:hypothetical protein